MSTREAAHPAVTSMGTLCLLGKQMPSHLAVLDHCGTSGSATSLHETWTILLWVTSPAPGGFAGTRLKCLSGA